MQKKIPHIWIEEAADLILPQPRRPQPFSVAKHHNYFCDGYPPNPNSPNQISSSSDVTAAPQHLTNSCATNLILRREEIGDREGGELVHVKLKG